MPPVSCDSLLVTALLLLSSFTEAVLFQSFSREPRNQFARVGDEVIFPCRIQHLQGIVQWTRNGFGLGFGKDLAPYARYSIVGSEGEGDWSLRIHPVELDDEGEYQCQVGGVNDVPPIGSNKANLSVIVPPSPPEIIQAGYRRRISTASGKDIELTCVSRGGKPPAEVNWIYSNGTKDLYTRKRVELDENGKTYTAMATIHFKADRNLDGMDLTCQAQNNAEVNPQTALVSLSVEYKPEVKVIMDKEYVKEGESLKVTCLARANPSNSLKYRWILDQDLVKDANSGLPLTVSEFLIDRVKREYHGKEVTCSVQNSRGTSKDSKKISVLYEPVLSVNETSRLGHEGERLVLECSADGQPKPTIVWYRNSKPTQILHTGSEMEIILSRHSEGDYFCAAKTEVFEEKRSQPIKVLMKKRPKIVNLDQTFYGKVGETVYLRCRAEIVPNTGSIIWRRKGRVLDDMATPHELNIDREDFGIVGVLSILSPTQDDFGSYECIVSDGDYRDGAVFELKEEGEVNIVAILGVVSGLLFTFLVLVIAAWCRNFAPVCGSNSLLRTMSGGGGPGGGMGEAASRWRHKSAVAEHSVLAEAGGGCLNTHQQVNCNGHSYHDEAGLSLGVAGENKPGQPRVIPTIGESKTSTNNNNSHGNVPNIVDSNSRGGQQNLPGPTNRLGTNGSANKETARGQCDLLGGREEVGAGISRLKRLNLSAASFMRDNLGLLGESSGINKTGTGGSASTYSRIPTHSHNNGVGNSTSSVVPDEPLAVADLSGNLTSAQVRNISYDTGLDSDDGGFNSENKPVRLAATRPADGTAAGGGRQDSLRNNGTWTDNNQATMPNSGYRNSSQGLSGDGTSLQQGPIRGPGPGYSQQTSSDCSSMSSGVKFNNSGKLCYRPPPPAGQQRPQPPANHRPPLQPGQRLPSAVNRAQQEGSVKTNSTSAGDANSSGRSPDDLPPISGVEQQRPRRAKPAASTIDGPVEAGQQHDPGQGEELEEDEEEEEGSALLNEASTRHPGWNEDPRGHLILNPPTAGAASAVDSQQQLQPYANKGYQQYIEYPSTRQNSSAAAKKNPQQPPQHSRRNTISQSIQVNRGEMSPNWQESGGAVETDCYHRPVNFYTNSLYLATARQNHWDLYTQVEPTESALGASDWNINYLARGAQVNRQHQPTVNSDSTVLPYRQAAATLGRRVTSSRNNLGARKKPIRSNSSELSLVSESALARERALHNTSATASRHYQAPASSNLYPTVPSIYADQQLDDRQMAYNCRYYADPYRLC